MVFCILFFAFIDVISEKVERAIQDAADQVDWETECEEGDSA